MMKDISKGFKKMLQNKSDSGELEEMLDMMQDEQYATLYATLIAEELAAPVAEGAISPELRERLDLRLKQILAVVATEELPSPKYSLRLKLAAVWPVAAAAVLIIGLGVGYYYWSGNKPEPKQQTAKAETFPAGTNKAILILANGKKVALDDTGTGIVASESGVTITKNAKGQLIYVISSAEKNLLNSTDKKSVQSRDDGTNAERTAYNTIITPNAGQYQVYLPDGSMVFLNAGSSLKYPLKFNTDERTVTLKGEAYFEIAKNQHKPFKVFTEKQVIQVLGTHFNVSSYEDEPVITTLAEGKIKLSTSSSSKDAIILKPGDQTKLSQGAFALERVNPEDVIAWKDGLFIFSNSNLKDVLRQIARWYNVQVDYASIPEHKFDGEIPRSIELPKVLDLIQAASNVPLKLEGRRIMRK